MTTLAFGLASQAQGNKTIGETEECYPKVFNSELCITMKERFYFQTWPRGYKTFYLLNSVEHEILNAHKYKNIKKFGLFNDQLSLECYFSRSYMLKCQQLLAF